MGCIQHGLGAGWAQLGVRGFYSPLSTALPRCAPAILQAEIEASRVRLIGLEVRSWLQ